MRVAKLGTNVVFDFGLWGKDERSALRWIADTLGVRAQVVYLPIDYEEQRRRIISRYETETGQFQMSDTELKLWQVSSKRRTTRNCKVPRSHRSRQGIRPGRSGRLNAGRRCRISTDQTAACTARLAPARCDDSETSAVDLETDQPARSSGLTAARRPHRRWTP